MSVLSIYTWPDPILAKATEKVTVFDGLLAKTVQDMFDSMYHHQGIGLAANQVGISQQIIVIDIDPSKEANDDLDWAEEIKSTGFKGPLVLINPVIKPLNTEKIIWEEGCLSLPGIYEKVERHRHIEVRAQDMQGAHYKMQAHAMLAVVIQHELDHLQGHVFIERIAPIKRKLIEEHLQKA
jgi:peptide deformylase